MEGMEGSRFVEEHIFSCVFGIIVECVYLPRNLIRISNSFEITET